MKTQKILITTIITALLCGCSNSGAGTDNSSQNNSSSDIDESYNPQKESYDDFVEYETLPVEPIQPKHDEIWDYGEFLGYNVRFNSKLGTINLVEQENRIFNIPDIYVMFNDINSQFSSSSSCQYIKGDTMGELANEFLFRFHIDEGVERFDSAGLDVACFRRIKALSVQKHLYNAFPHAVSKIDGNDKTTYFIASESNRCTTHYIRNIPGWYRDTEYYNPTFLTDFANAVNKDDYETYCAFFDKYGIGLVNSYSYWSSSSTYMAFHSSKGEKAEELFNPHETPTKEDLERVLATNRNLTLTDYWVNSSEETETRLADYSIYPISLMIPNGYDHYDTANKIHPALIDYINAKCNALEDEINAIDEVPNYLNDTIEVMKKDDETKAQKVWNYNSTFIENIRSYNPRVLKEKGYKKVLVRPSVTLSADHESVVANCNITLGGKNALLVNDKRVATSENTIEGKWFEFDISDIVNAYGEIEYNTWFDKQVAPEKVEIQLCYIR